MIIQDAVNLIIDMRTDPRDHVLPEDVTVKFGTEALHKHMTFVKLVDNNANSFRTSTSSGTQSIGMLRC